MMRSFLLSAAILAAIGVLYREQGQVHGQPASPPPVIAKPGAADLKGVAGCKLCHSTKDVATNPAVEDFRKLGSEKFIKFDENLTWRAHDLHSRAFQNLSGPLGQRMESILKRNPKNSDSYQVTADAACLACHATDRKPRETWEQKQKNPEEAFLTTQGVTCEMCHGYASRWNERHVEITQVKGKEVLAWREWPPAEKSEWGFVNLRDPAVRAEKCASCHVGNKAEGKFVTHEMYAAGHPPLPPLDVATYTRDQPRHWGLPRELPYLTSLAKNPETAQKAWDLFHYRDEDSEVHAARQLAESTLATFHSTMTLLDQQASTPEGLDFASFDCYSCHHDLKVPSDRQKRGYPGVPGRPMFRPSTEVLARIIVQHASEMKDGEALKPRIAQLDAAYRDLALGFGAKTYGNAALIRAAVAKLETWYREVAADLHKVRYTREDTLNLLKAIVAAGVDKSEMIADAESAQVVAWAFLTLTAELEATSKEKVDLAELAKLEKELEALVVTRLRSDPLAMKDARTPDPLNPTAVTDKTPIPVEDRIAARMRTFNQFDAPKFRDLFRRIELLLPKIK